jgi:rhamnosyl/mannosyltransferase
MRFLDICSGVVVTSPNYLVSSPVLAAFQQKCHAIPYGIPTDDFQYYDEKKVENIRGRYGDRIIVTVGRLVYYKGIEYLIRAMREIDGRLLIIGDGPLRASLEREAIRNRVLDKVEFLGRRTIKEIVPYYHAADVFALASVSRSEAFGIVQLEAMACGKPVVNTNIASGVPFVSINELTGLTVPPSDSHALAKAINKLLWDSQLRTDFGRAARLRVLEEFNLDLMIKRTMNLYENILLDAF